MMTGTVERFKLHLQTLDSMQDIKMSTYETILRESVRFYTVLYTGINQWLPLTKQPSMFMGNGNNNNNGNNGGPSSIGLPRGMTINEPKPTHDAKGNIIDRNPPSKGESIIRDSKTMSGKREYWCETCGRWGSHDANHHDAWKQRSKEYFANKKRSGSHGPAGNLANGDNNHDGLSERKETSTAPVVPVTGSSNLSMLKRLVKFSDE
jgi:hypothetical protein